jgi:transcription elongation factor Elf1
MEERRCPECWEKLTVIEADKNKNKYVFVCKKCDLKIETNPDPETLVSITRKHFRADWYNAGEGYKGDYDPENPEDENLLRFDVYYSPDADGKWEEVEDASYCTTNSVDTLTSILIRKLYTILKEYENSGYPDNSVKKLGETLSWI